MLPAAAQPVRRTTAATAQGFRISGRLRRTGLPFPGPAVTAGPGHRQLPGLPGPV